jgi:peptide deformylase
MTIKTVLRIGEPSLLQRSKEVTEFNTPWLDALVADLWDTMQAQNGAGLAAPQINKNVRIIVFGFDKNERYPDAPEIPRSVLINPQIEFIGDDMDEQWEGCLSVPGLRARVPRYRKIRYSGFNQKGEHFNREVEDFHARVVQHECDHLDGILYPQRIRDMRSFGFTEELERCGQLIKQPCDD